MGLEMTHIGLFVNLLTLPLSKELLLRFTRVRVRKTLIQREVRVQRQTSFFLGASGFSQGPFSVLALIRRVEAPLRVMSDV